MLGWRLFSKYGGISANRRSITRAVRLAGLSSESQCSRGRGNNRRRHSGRRQIRSSSWGNWRRANPPSIARAIHFARRLFGVFRAELESLRPLVEAILPTGARHPCRLHLAAVTGPSNPTKGSAPIGSASSIERLPPPSFQARPALPWRAFLLLRDSWPVMAARSPTLRCPGTGRPRSHPAKPPRHGPPPAGQHRDLKAELADGCAHQVNHGIIRARIAAQLSIGLVCVS